MGSPGPGPGLPRVLKSRTVFRYTIRRILLIIPTFIGASALVFFAGFALPGDPVSAFAGERALPEATRKVLVERYRLDQPLVNQYLGYMGDVLTGDFGESVLKRRSVNSIFAETFPNTLKLAGLAITFELIVGLLAGIVAALRKDKFLDSLVLVTTIIAISIPVFVLGFSLQYLVGVRWQILPVAGLQEGFRSLIMPSFVLGVLSLAYVARLTRTSLAETLREDYIRTAQAKGLRSSRVIGRHALRNASDPRYHFHRDRPGRFDGWGHRHRDDLQHQRGRVQSVPGDRLAGQRHRGRLHADRGDDLPLHEPHRRPHLRGPRPSHPL